MEKNSGNVCSEDDDIPASIAILFSAHEFLGVIITEIIKLI